MAADLAAAVARVLRKRAFEYDTALEEFDAARERLGRALAARLDEGGVLDTGWLRVRCRELVRAHVVLAYAQRRLDSVMEVKRVVRGEAGL